MSARKTPRNASSFIWSSVIQIHWWQACRWATDAKYFFSKTKVHAPHKEKHSWMERTQAWPLRTRREGVDSYRRPSGLLAMTRAGRVDPMGMHELQTENISVCAPHKALVFASKTVQTFWLQIQQFLVVRRSHDTPNAKTSFPSCA